MLWTISSAEYLEGVYVQSQFVQQIFVYGDSLKSVLVAIVVPKADNLKLWAKQEGIEVSSLHKHNKCTQKERDRELTPILFLHHYSQIEYFQKICYNQTRIEVSCSEGNIFSLFSFLSIGTR
jgi:long-subunit acyl-CoA synthetase (AMP-forming)